MRHSHTSRISAKTILAFVSLGLAAACGDSASAPMREVAHKAPAGYDEVLGSLSFVYNPSSGAIKRIGSHILVIPANGVCDLSSSYGVGTWDDDCTPATQSFVITATTYADSGGHPYIDFQPALRFVPTLETDLYMLDGERDSATVITMDYCSDSGCVDESLTDSSLVTQRVGLTRYLVRRIKHFSGYMLFGGDYCSGSTVDDPSGGLWCELDGLSRSGYMMASGLDKSGSSSWGAHRKKAKQ